MDRIAVGERAEGAERELMFGVDPGSDVIRLVDVGLEPAIGMGCQNVAGVRVRLNDSIGLQGREVLLRREGQSDGRGGDE